MAEKLRSKPKNKTGQGRKAEGRVRRNVLMHAEAWSALEAKLQGKGDSLGRVVERLVGVPNKRNPAAAAKI